MFTVQFYDNRGKVEEDCVTHPNAREQLLDESCVGLVLLTAIPKDEE